MRLPQLGHFRISNLVYAQFAHRDKPRHNKETSFHLLPKYAGPDHRAWRAPAQPQEYRRRDSPQQPHRHYRSERFGQIFAGLRHDLRRRPAALRGNAFHLRAPVSGPDGAARRRFHRRPEPGHFHRAEDHQPQPALHGRHHYRNLRLPPAAVLLHRRSALPDLRQRDFAPDHRADSAARAGAQARGPHHGPGPHRARPQGRVQEGAGKAAAPGLRARPHRWRAALARRRNRPRQAQESHHRSGGRPPAGEAGHREAPGSFHRHRHASWPMAWC